MTPGTQTSIKEVEEDDNNNNNKIPLADAIHQAYENNKFA